MRRLPPPRTSYRLTTRGADTLAALLCLTILSLVLLVGLAGNGIL